MVSTLLPVLIFLGVPLLLLFLYKSNAGVMFLSACTGLVLLENLDATVVTTASAVVPGEGEAYIRLAVVVLSIFFAALMFRNSVHGSALMLHILICIFLAGTLWLTLPSATGLNWLLDISQEPIWEDINNFKGLIIAAGFSLSLVAVMTAKHRRKHKH